MDDRDSARLRSLAESRPGEMNNSFRFKGLRIINAESRAVDSFRDSPQLQPLGLEDTPVERENFFLVAARFD